MSDCEYLLTLSVSEFKAVKLAVKTMMRAGVSREIAVMTVVDGNRTKHGKSYGWSQRQA
jgi:hypothetical protein